MLITRCLRDHLAAGVWCKSDAFLAIEAGRFVSRARNSSSRTFKTAPKIEPRLAAGSQLVTQALLDSAAATGWPRRGADEVV